MTVGRTSRTDSFRITTFVGSGPFMCGTVRDECGYQFGESIKARGRELKAVLEQYAAEAREQEISVRLTDEQLKYLSATYDPENMTWEEYQAFVDDLCEYGVLNEEDKDHIYYNGLEPLPCIVGSCCIRPTGTAPYSYDHSFSSNGGNVLDWSRYLSTFEYYDEHTQSFERTHHAILFDRIHKVLARMGA